MSEIKSGVPCSSGSVFLSDYIESHGFMPVEEMREVLESNSELFGGVTADVYKEALVTSFKKWCEKCRLNPVID